MVTKHDKVVKNCNKLPSIKSHESLIILSLEVTWQTQYIICPLAKDL